MVHIKKTTSHKATGSVGRGRCCAYDCYNRARQRIRARQSERPQTMETAASAAMASFASNQWKGPSGPYRQQVMPGWQASLTLPEMICCLAVLAVASGCLTAASFACWLSTAEVELDYTACANSTPALCRLSLRVTSNLTAPLYLYYAMHNAYFNHRKIQVAWSMPQLLGLPTGDLAKPCRGLARRDGQPVLPCGALPDAIFNDTFAIFRPDAGNGKDAEIPVSSEGIGWPSDAGSLYQALPADRLSGTTRPVSWPAPAAERYRRPFEDAEDLHVWLRTPAFSSFRKMRHRLLLPAGDGLRSGTYRLDIGYNYPVADFRGVKRFIVAEKSAFGGKNITLVLLPLGACASYLLLCISTLIEGYCRQRKCFA